MMNAQQARTRPPGRATAHGAPRERLLSAAARLFAEKGYASTSVGEIVSAAAVTKPVLYYWFQSKEGIFLHLMEDGFARFDSALAAVRATEDDGPARLRALCSSVIDLVNGNLEIARIVYAITYGPPQGAPAFDFQTVHARIRTAVREELERGIARGEFRRGAAEECLWAVIGSMSICIEIRLCHPELSPDVHELFDRIFGVLLRGIAEPET